MKIGRATCCAMLIPLFFGAGWWWMTCHQPSFWIRARERACMYVVSKNREIESLLNQAQNDLRMTGRFQLELPEDAIIVWLRQFEQRHYDSMPLGITWFLIAPRSDVLRLGYQDRSRIGQPVIWMEARPRLSPKGEILIELNQLHSGRWRLDATELKALVEATDFGTGLQFQLVIDSPTQATLQITIDPTTFGLRLTRVDSVPDGIVIEGRAVETTN